MVKVGIIGGTGLEDPLLLEEVHQIQELETPYGRISDHLVQGKIGGVSVVLLSRHGRDHSISPTNVNYRANIWALANQGVTVIIVSTACGSLQEHIMPGDLLFPDSCFDRTLHRQSTFFDGKSNHLPGVCHAPMHPLFNEKLRQLQILISTAESMRADFSLESPLNFHKEGFAVCIEGPRFSTRAESNVFRSWGASIINMTIMPESALAKEVGIPYASTALVTDYDCWKDNETVSVERVANTLRDNADKARKLFVKAIAEISKVDWSEEIAELKKAARASVMLPPDIKIPLLE